MDLRLSVFTYTFTQRDINKEIAVLAVVGSHLPTMKKVTGEDLTPSIKVLFFNFSSILVIVDSIRVFSFGIKISPYSFFSIIEYLFVDRLQSSL